MTRVHSHSTQSPSLSGQEQVAQNHSNIYHLLDSLTIHVVHIFILYGSRESTSHQPAGQRCSTCARFAVYARTRRLIIAFRRGDTDDSAVRVSNPFPSLIFDTSYTCISVAMKVREERVNAAFKPAIISQASLYTTRFASDDPVRDTD